MQEEYSGAIYIIGPNNKDGYEKTLAFFNSKFKKVVVIGDGEMDILNSDGEGPLQNLKTLAQDHPELNEGKILVYVDAHGKELDDGHHVQVANDLIFESKKLFALLAENIKKPIDIIFIPCNGKADLVDIDSLTLGSRIIFFSEPDKITNAANVQAALDALSNDNFTFDGFYNNYLARIFSMYEDPIMVTAGGKTIDPISLSETYTGKTISETSRKYVHDNFARSVCKSDSICHDKIDQLMNKIELNSSIEEFKVTASDSYSTVLYESSEIITNYEFRRNSNHEKDVVYNYKKSEYCYVEILELKNKTDQLLLEHGIGLELDLSNQNWYEIDYDYDDVLDWFKACSDACIHSVFTFSGFIENNNFPKPEYGEYGYVLGIIKDIHLSLSLVGDFEPV